MQRPWSVKSDWDFKAIIIEESSELCKKLFENLIGNLTMHETRFKEQNKHQELGTMEVLVTQK